MIQIPMHTFIEFNIKPVICLSLNPNTRSVEQCNSDFGQLKQELGKESVNYPKKVIYCKINNFGTVCRSLRGPYILGERQGGQPGRS